MIHRFLRDNRFSKSFDWFYGFTIRFQRDLSSGIIIILSEILSLILFPYPFLYFACLIVSFFLFLSYNSRSTASFLLLESHLVSDKRLRDNFLVITSLFLLLSFLVWSPIVSQLFFEEFLFSVSYSLSLKSLSLHSLNPKWCLTSCLSTVKETRIPWPGTYK